MPSEHSSSHQNLSCYTDIRKRACQIAVRFPTPDFFRDFSDAVSLSEKTFQTDPIVVRLYAFVAEKLENDFGHGMEHAVKVTRDAGALTLIEGKAAGCSDDFINQRLIISQCAGLLHDIRRKEKNHAAKGAEYARNLLKNYPFSPDEAEDICQAIQNHEAFKTPLKIKTPEGLLVSDCLYDADKFRWGPDNFTATVWDMVSFSKTPLSEFIAFYPKAMERLAKIKDTFRTRTGKKYGPRFIDTGLAIGEELYKVITSEFIRFI
ncbi:MAG: hypothetical protein BWK80_34120 [Desulfobacteraceae bacterium IS3]|nr:MAG: hypothetical protein BWK80_34120 [Desulfobacteraceae bacterium IS3]